MMGRISIQDIARNIADKHGLSQQEAELFVSTLFNVIDEWLHIEKIVKVKGLGTFKVIDVRERESVNVNTGERVVIESHGKITFTPDPIMRDLVNKPFAQFDTVVLNDGVDLEEINRVQEDGSEADNAEDRSGRTSDIDVEELSADGAADIDSVEDEYENVSEREADTVDEWKEIQNDEPQQDVLTEQDADVTDGNSADETASAEEETAAADVAEAAETVTEQPLDGSESKNDSDVEPETDDGQHEENVEYGVITKALKRQKIVFAVSAVVICVVAFLAGYYWGCNTVKPVVKYKVVHVMDKMGNVQPQTKDTLQKSKPVAAQDKKEQTSAETETKRPAETVKKEVESKPIAQSEALSVAQRMVRTGAYRIVGTQKTIKVKKGETLRSISKFYLGDGMECYVQVHNGISDVKEGMTLKIPKLQIKRRK